MKTLKDNLNRLYSTGTNPMLCDDLDGCGIGGWGVGVVQEGENICSHIPDSLCCIKNLIYCKAIIFFKKDNLNGRESAK